MEYFIGDGNFDYRLIFVLGTSRAGKSLFSRLLSTAENIDWIFEPQIIQASILLSQLGGGLDERYADNLLKAACKEIINSDILLRNANFRPNDMSSIYNCKDAATIFERLVNVNSRDDVVEYIKSKKMYFIMDIPNLLPYVAYIKKVFPKAKIIHVVRNGYQVAEEVSKKKWYSIERMRKREDNYVFYWKYQGENGEIFFLPWWLPSERTDDFIKGTDELRSVLYWNYSLDSLSNTEATCVDMTVRYEDLVSEPKIVMKQVEKIINCNWTPKSYSVINELENRDLVIHKEQILNSLKDEDRILFKQLLRRYHYEE